MLNTQKPKQAVCIWDPAIDTDETDIVQYVQKRDFTKLKYRAGAKPEVYHLRALTHDICAWVCAAPDGPERQTRAFFACVVQVDNLKIIAEDGRLLNEHGSWAPDAISAKAERVASTFDLFTKDEKAIFSPATVYEIGEVAWRYSFFPRGIAPTFVLPPTSVQIWGAASFHHAEQVPSTPVDGPTEQTNP